MGGRLLLGISLKSGRIGNETEVFLTGQGKGLATIDLSFTKRVLVYALHRQRR